LPPVASFKWFPAAPQVGESVSLVSTSTDASSAITTFAWSLKGNNEFTEGASSLATSFSTAGNHVVQLRVTDANGQSSVVSETIVVSKPVLTLMQPFPVVRIAGSYSSTGAKISLLTVQVPVGAKVTVSCHGSGCPSKSQSVIASAGKSASKKVGMVLITFKRFERSLRPGAVLQIRVFENGHIGKFTRFAVHHSGPPTRSDTCLNQTGITPIGCTSS